MLGPQEGVVAIAFAIFSAFVLPNYPHTTRWLNEEEKAFAAWRLLKDVNETDEYADKSVWAGLKLAVRDYRLYLFVLMQHVSLLSQSFQYFFPTIVATLGYGDIVTLWLTAPVWVCWLPSGIVICTRRRSFANSIPSAWSTVCHAFSLYLCYMDVRPLQ